MLIFNWCWFWVDDIVRLSSWRYVHLLNNLNCDSVLNSCWYCVHLMLISSWYIIMLILCRQWIAIWCWICVDFGSIVYVYRLLLLFYPIRHINLLFQLWIEKIWKSFQSQQQTQVDFLKHKIFYCIWTSLYLLSAFVITCLTVWCLIWNCTAYISDRLVIWLSPIHLVEQEHQQRQQQQQ